MGNCHAAPLISKRHLYREYFLKNKTCEQIAKEAGIGKTTVIRYLKKFGYKRRSPIADVLGKKIGKLLVVKHLGVMKGKQCKNTGHYWECLCECGKTKIYNSSSLNNVRSCGCAQYYNRTGIRGRYWAKIKRDAKKRNISFDILPEEAWEIYLEQDGKCYFSGIKIFIQNNVARSGKKTYEFTASLDRLDSSKGYSKDNCVWVHKNVNVMKNCMSPLEFVTLCKLIAKNRKNDTCVAINDFYVSDLRRNSKN